MNTDPPSLPKLNYWVKFCQWFAISSDSIEGRIGSNSSYIVVGKNIIQIGKLKAPLWLAALVACTSTIAAAVVISWFLLYIGLFPMPDIPPSRPQGKINMACAGTVTLGVDGKQQDTQPDDELSDSICQGIRDAYELAQSGPVRIIRSHFAANQNNPALDKAYDSWDIWPTRYTGQIEGDTEQERRTYAEDLAGSLGVHLLLYVVTDQASQKTWLEFYVNTPGIEYGEEIVSRYQLGQPLTSGRNAYERGDIISDFVERARTLMQFTLAMYYYAKGDYPTVVSLLDQDCLELQSPSAVVVHQMLGNTYYVGRDQTAPNYHLDRALYHFACVARARPTFPRANMGEAAVLLQKAAVTHDANNELQQARTLLETVLQHLAIPDTNFYADDPARVDLLKVKAHVELGRVFWAYAYLYPQDGAQHYAAAKQELQAAITEYKDLSPPSPLADFWFAQATEMLSAIQNAEQSLAAGSSPISPSAAQQANIMYMLSTDRGGSSPLETSSADPMSTDVALQQSDCQVEAEPRLRVRTGPGPEYERINSVENGQLIHLVGRNHDGSWLMIDSPVSGWISRYYVSSSCLWDSLPDTTSVEQIGIPGTSSAIAQPTDQAALPTPCQALATEGLRVRKGPGLEYENINGVQNGAFIQLVGRNHDGSWLMIVSPVSGWIFGDYVSSSCPRDWLPDITPVEQISVAPAVSPSENLAPSTDNTALPDSYVEQNSNQNSHEDSDRDSDDSDDSDKAKDKPKEKPTDFPVINASVPADPIATATPMPLEQPTAAPNPPSVLNESECQQQSMANSNSPFNVSCSPHLQSGPKPGNPFEPNIPPIKDLGGSRLP